MSHKPPTPTSLPRRRDEEENVVYWEHSPQTRRPSRKSNLPQTRESSTSTPQKISQVESNTNKRNCAAAGMPSPSKTVIDDDGTPPGQTSLVLGGLNGSAGHTTHRASSDQQRKPPRKSKRQKDRQSLQVADLTRNSTTPNQPTVPALRPSSEMGLLLEILEHRVLGKPSRPNALPDKARSAPTNTTVMLDKGKARAPPPSTSITTRANSDPVAVAVAPPLRPQLHPAPTRIPTHKSQTNVSSLATSNASRSISAPRTRVHNPGPSKNVGSSTLSPMPKVATPLTTTKAGQPFKPHSPASLFRPAISKPGLASNQPINPRQAQQRLAALETPTRPSSKLGTLSRTVVSKPLAPLQGTTKPVPQARSVQASRPPLVKPTHNLRVAPVQNLTAGKLITEKDVSVVKVVTADEEIQSLLSGLCPDDLNWDLDD